MLSGGLPSAAFDVPCAGLAGRRILRTRLLQVVAGAGGTWWAAYGHLAPHSLEQLWIHSHGFERLRHAVRQGDVGQDLVLLICREGIIVKLVHNVP